MGNSAISTQSVPVVLTYQNELTSLNAASQNVSKSFEKIKIDKPLFKGILDEQQILSKAVNQLATQLGSLKVSPELFSSLKQFKDQAIALQASNWLGAGEAEAERLVRHLDKLIPQAQKLASMGFGAISQSVTAQPVSNRIPLSILEKTDDFIDPNSRDFLRNPRIPSLGYDKQQQQYAREHNEYAGGIVENSRFLPANLQANPQALLSKPDLVRSQAERAIENQPRLNAAQRFNNVLSGIDDRQLLNRMLESFGRAKEPNADRINRIQNRLTELDPSEKAIGRLLQEMGRLEGGANRAAKAVHGLLPSRDDGQTGRRSGSGAGHVPGDRSSFRSTFLAQNVAFGVDDFIQQYTYAGGKAAMRAVSNNLTAVLAFSKIGSPLMMGAGVIGTSVATAVLGQQMEEDSRRKQEDIKNFTDQLNKLRDAASQPIQIRIATIGQNPNQIADSMVSLSGKMAELEAERLAIPRGGGAGLTQKQRLEKQQEHAIAEQTHWLKFWAKPGFKAGMDKLGAGYGMGTAEYAQQEEAFQQDKANKEVSQQQLAATNQKLRQMEREMDIKKQMHQLSVSEDRIARGTTNLYNPSMKYKGYEGNNKSQAARALIEYEKQSGREFNKFLESNNFSPAEQEAYIGQYEQGMRQRRGQLGQTQFDAQRRAFETQESYKAGGKVFDQFGLNIKRQLRELETSTLPFLNPDQRSALMSDAGLEFERQIKNFGDQEILRANDKPINNALEIGSRSDAEFRQKMMTLGNSEQEQAQQLRREMLTELKRIADKEPLKIKLAPAGK